ncbi:photosensitized INA-labeled protein PHIL1 [Plasmodium brasilianum]|uniref:Photosensitized INA-labeled protein PHIL1, putative n=2 Tax=Plasmodium (Plasmodium) TaxID=418103 RepID=A0A1A8X1H6_PLAMA|nr:photosensitized INA-labeled protein PHIL1, putative [Plasmodium malariae]KAI4840911.1 photosensitized INA-labeled protein PHIL1 [Plasmodium brasilianum]SBS99082.1 photosensitized INA-labeled protein PHIL1, putative (PHIL1) [Plasmodium malariae]SBT87105.1 photosensitized INA-labeled protein PHIL1, putative [Plasmodium malariae]
MLFSGSPKIYSYNKKGNIKKLDFFSCKSIILPQEHIDTKNNLICTTKVIPNTYETICDNIFKMQMAHDNNYDNERMGTNAYDNRNSNIYSVNIVPCDDGNFNNYTDVNVNVNVNANDMNQPLMFEDGAQGSADPAQPIDPGVVAVSNALFAYNNAFQCIPIKSSPNVFRRRSKGEANSEWSNAFVTRVDPCACGDAEEEFKPYEVTKYYDEGKVKTVFNFDQDNCKEAI